ncbi:hypothetical protein VFPPC_00911 [Pochonia chlamydosporia 170]|uniref:Uncharacterized protein n=1 Tax=Pochonia chlamydosporia 170 TaxID=1380566 RepID=A0A179G6I3_METCM|nr:hypothetical protein VFPPC_00911 [Pochonia chlamydosporia 170]OAQ73120.1 hypothetical protein VFPPC_00911 [Pochonia chlamydosporia 170]
MLQNKHDQIQQRCVGKRKYLIAIMSGRSTYLNDYYRLGKLARLSIYDLRSTERSVWHGPFE